MVDYLVYGLLISLSFCGSLPSYCINSRRINTHLLSLLCNSNITAVTVCSMHRAVEQLHYIISYWYNGGGSSRYFNDVILINK